MEKDDVFRDQECRGDQTYRKDHNTNHRSIRAVRSECFEFHVIYYYNIFSLNLKVTWDA